MSDQTQNPVLTYSEEVADAIAVGLSMLREKREQIAQRNQDRKEAALKETQAKWAPYLALAERSLPAWTEAFRAAIPADCNPSDQNYSVILNIPTCTRIRVQLHPGSEKVFFYVQDSIVRRINDETDEMGMEAVESNTQYFDFSLALGVAFESSAKLTVAKRDDQIVQEKIKADKAARLAEKASADPLLSLKELRREMDQRYLKGVPEDYRFEADYMLKTGNSTEAIVYALMLISDKLSLIANSL